MSSADIASLHVDTGGHWRGGQQQALCLVEGLRARRLRAELVAPRRSVLAERASESGIAVHALPLRGEWDLASAFRIAGILKKGGFGILHLHTSHAHGLGRLASLLCPGLCLIVSKRVDFPIRGNIGRRLKYRRGVEKYLAISCSARDVLLRAGVRPERVVLVADGVDPLRFEGVVPADLKTELGFPADSVLVGVVGHLIAEHKGQEDFLRSAVMVAARFREAKFLLVGEGRDRVLLEKLAAEAGIADRVAFTGFRSDVPAVLASLDVFVMPSHAEAMGTSAIEAMMAGLPVVGTDVGGLKEVIDDGRTGLLVPPKDPARLAEAISNLLADPGLARRMGAQGRQRAHSRFTTDNMVEKTIQVYEEVQNARRRSRALHS